jgi:hypothetical protein
MRLIVKNINIYVLVNVLLHERCQKKCDSTCTYVIQCNPRCFVTSFAYSGMRHRVAKLRLFFLLLCAFCAV